MPTLPSPTRRVLGDKTPNASVKRRADEPTAKSHLDYSISDEPKALMRYAFEVEVENHVTPKAGQKRRIHEIEDTEEQDRQSRDKASSTSPITVLPTEPNSETDDMGPSSTNPTTTATSTLLGSFHASQEQLMSVEDQFDIQDEMSQQTLDKIHAAPISHSSSQLQPTLHPSLVTEASQDSVQMSSFVDFGPNEREDNLTMIPPEPVVSTENRSTKAAMEEKAETLRTRLQLAFYKVQTNQVDKPFSRLEQPRPSSPELPPQPPSLRRTSPEGIIAAARARATQQKKPAVRSLDSLPLPNIVPTAYSARYMQIEEDEPPSQSSAQSSVGTIKGSSEGARRLALSRTPTLAQEDWTMFPKTPMQLGSPPKGDMCGPTLKPDQGTNLVSGLTSSVVKGEAANGLLELMRAAAG